MVTSAHEVEDDVKLAIVLILAFLIGVALAGVIRLRDERVAAPAPGETVQSMDARGPAATTSTATIHT